MSLLVEIPDSCVVLYSKGMYYQPRAYAYDGAIYAKWKNGFIKLKAGHQTSMSMVVWQTIKMGDEILKDSKKKDPSWKGNADD